MLPSVRTQSVAFMSLFVMACSLGPLEAPAPLRPPIIPRVPKPPSTVSRLVLSLDTREAFVGLTLRLHVAAFDVEGRKMASHLSVVTSSNPEVAQFAYSQAVGVAQPNGPSVSEMFHYITMVGSGTAVLRVTLGNVTDSTVLNIRPLPLAMNVLAVDSFTVLEFQWCATCSGLNYVPLLKLREPTGTSYADVIAVEFTLPTRSTGYCTTGGMHFSSGLAAHVNYIDPDYYNNEMIFWSEYPVPEGPAKARIVVRDASGTYGLIEATAPIQRQVANPALPPVANFDNSWSCSARTSGAG